MTYYSDAYAETSNFGPRKRNHGAHMVVPRYQFTFTYAGRADRTKRNERFAVDHEIVMRHPERFAPAPATDSQTRTRLLRMQRSRSRTPAGRQRKRTAGPPWSLHVSPLRPPALADSPLRPAPIARSPLRGGRPKWAL